MDRTESTVLLKQARAGSAEALNRLYDRVAARLLVVIRLRMGASLRARLESRDILQATLLKAFQHIDRFEGGDGASLLAWLARIAEHEIRDQADYHGRQRRDAALAAPLDDAGGDVAARVRSVLSQLVVDEQTRRLEQAIESLEPAHREVILLRKLQDLSFKEVAERMSRSEDACRMLLARAMVALTLRMHDAP